MSKIQRWSLLVLAGGVTYDVSTEIAGIREIEIEGPGVRTAKVVVR